MINSYEKNIEECKSGKDVLEAFADSFNYINSLDERTVGEKYEEYMKKFISKRTSTDNKYLDLIYLKKETDNGFSILLKYFKNNKYINTSKEEPKKMKPSKELLEIIKLLESKSSDKDPIREKYKGLIKKLYNFSNKNSEYFNCLYTRGGYDLDDHCDLTRFLELIGFLEGGTFTLSDNFHAEEMLNQIYQETRTKLKSDQNTEEVIKEYLWVEGKTDLTHLMTAWRSIYPGYMPNFEIEIIGGTPEIGLHFTKSKVKSALQNTKVLALLDFDNGYGLFKKCKDRDHNSRDYGNKNTGLYIFRKAYRNHVLSMLPVPRRIENLARTRLWKDGNSKVVIEHLFPTDFLKKSDMFEKRTLVTKENYWSIKKMNSKSDFALFVRKELLSGNTSKDIFKDFLPIFCLINYVWE
jgi:hypothetical protein